jgi:hypothetical protein
LASGFQPQKRRSIDALKRATTGFGCNNLFVTRAIAVAHDEFVEVGRVTTLRKSLPGRVRQYLAHRRTLQRGNYFIHTVLHATISGPPVRTGRQSQQALHARPAQEEHALVLNQRVHQPCGHDQGCCTMTDDASLKATRYRASRPLDGGSSGQVAGCERANPPPMGHKPKVSGSAASNERVPDISAR